MSICVSGAEYNGLGNAGGIDSPTFVKDGGTSSPHLGLCLVCAYGTPVADMLVHSPPLTLVIDYYGHDITA